MDAQNETPHLIKGITDPTKVIETPFKTLKVNIRDKLNIAVPEHFTFTKEEILKLIDYPGFNALTIRILTENDELKMYVLPAVWNISEIDADKIETILPNPYPGGGDPTGPPILKTKKETVARLEPAQ